MSAANWGVGANVGAVNAVAGALSRVELQKDRRSREELIDILETFVEAGWPSARRLSYRLEEIFR